MKTYPGVLARASGLLVALLLAAPWAQACGPYDIAFYELGSLYYQNASKQYVGIDKDLIEEIGRRSGCRFRQESDARARIWILLAEGSLDMSVSGIPTPERDQFARFIIYFQTRNHLLMAPEKAARIDSLRAFYADPALRLGVVKSFKHGKGFDAWIDTLRALGRVTEYVDADAVFSAFVENEIDGLLAMPVVWGPLVLRHKLDGKVSYLDIAPDDRVPHGLILSRKRVSEPDAERLRAAMEAMRSDGTLEKIFQRHLGADLARRIMP